MHSCPSALSMLGRRTHRPGDCPQDGCCGYESGFQTNCDHGDQPQGAASWFFTFNLSSFTCHLWIILFGRQRQSGRGYPVHPQKLPALHHKSLFLFAILAPYHASVSTPKNANLFLSEPLHPANRSWLYFKSLYTSRIYNIIFSDLSSSFLGIWEDV